MTLTEGISAIRDRFQDHLSDGIAFSRYDPAANASEIHRIRDVLVKSNEVLLLIDPEPLNQSGTGHITVADLLARLTGLPPECGQYALEACKPEIEFKEENTRIRYDYPIVTTGRAEALQLCLLAYIEQKRNRPPKPWWKFWQRT